MDPALDATAEPPPPRDLDGLREAILTRRQGLPKRLVQVAEYAMAHPQDIAFGTVAEVAAAASVQPSTLVRFAQALGYPGFSGLQSVFRAHARGRWPDYPERLEALRAEPGAASGNVGPLLHGFIDASIASLERLASVADAPGLEQAVDLLAGARSICLLASRRSFPVAVYLAYAMRRLAIRCELVDQLGGLALEQVSLLDRGDAVVVVSFTPYAPATIELAAAAFARGAAVVAITDSAFSPLAQVATVWLEVAEADHAAFRSLAATLALATTLAVAVAERRRDATAA